MKNKTIKNTILISIIAILVGIGLSYLNQNSVIDPIHEYNIQIEKQDRKIDSLNKLLIISNTERNKLISKLDEIKTIEIKTHETFKTNYYNIVSGGVNDDSICRFIANEIYNEQRYHNWLYPIGK